MDADFSHDPAHLKEFLKAVEGADLVLGSRYLNGKVTVVNWPMTRLMLSYCANIYARRVTGLRMWDLTGGFKCFRRRVLEAIDLSLVRSNGYAFQIEMSVRAWRKGFRLTEIPIVFVDRTEGHSKMNRAIVREAVWMVPRHHPDRFPDDGPVHLAVPLGPVHEHDGYLGQPEPLSPCPHAHFNLERVAVRPHQ